MKAILTAFALTALPVTAMAQEQESGSPIVVEAHRNAQSVHDAVKAISVTSDSAGVLGRWNHRICPSVAGVSTTDAQAIIDRIARRAIAVGLQTGAPGCSPNITIVVTPDSDRFAQEVYNQRRQVLVGVDGASSTTLGSTALDDFVHISRPVRWWTVSQTVMSDGRALGDTNAHPLQGDGAASARETAAVEAGDPASAGGGGLSGVNVTRSTGSRLVRQTRRDFNYSLVIVDSTRVAGAPLTAIADYVAFVTLAQINMNASVEGYPSILSLFATSPSGETRPTQLTAWDMAYLDGIYHMTPNARNVQQQRAEIVRRIVQP
jgi:hypothetical protein